MWSKETESAVSRTAAAADQAWKKVDEYLEEIKALVEKIKASEQLTPEDRILAEKVLNLVVGEVILRRIEVKRHI